MKILRWLASLIGVAALVAIGLYVFGYLRIEVTNADPRPRGTLYDIEGLKRRDDVNVLFILTDTLRAHRLSAYGYERETSPTFDYMASTGVRFARHLAQSTWTKCSMASLWTGLYPQRTGVLRSEHAAPEEALMPAEVFLEAGFRTAGLWRNGWVAPNFGFAQGFEVYEKPVPRDIGPHMRLENPHIKLEGTDNELVDAAVEFLRVHGHERWFLYVHLMDVHQYLYDSRNALWGPTYSDIYDNSIRHTDEIIGRLLAEVIDAGLMEKTLVVMGADHGEAFSERGLEGHAREVFRETTEVPFVLGFPFKLDPGIVVETRSRNVDIWPTVFDLVGLPALPDTDGRSLVPDLFRSAQGKAIEDDTVGVAHLDRGWGRKDNPFRPAVAVTKGMFRYVLQQGAEGDEDDPTIESLFDAGVDPLEQTNSIEEHADLAEELRGLARAYLDHSPPAPWGSGAVTVEIDEMEAKQLRALGYAVE
ncbi:MAG: sulfatase [Deltaproteobacteria bacterium]|jgi:arylsulfatase|nr:sulfatase [Deltaproteobacteria bacterium]